MKSNFWRIVSEAWALYAVYLASNPKPCSGEDMRPDAETVDAWTAKLNEITGTDLPFPHTYNYRVRCTHQSNKIGFLCDKVVWNLETWLASNGTVLPETDKEFTFPFEITLTEFLAEATTEEKFTAFVLRAFARAHVIGAVHEALHFFMIDGQVPFDPHEGGWLRDHQEFDFVWLAMTTGRRDRRYIPSPFLLGKLLQAEQDDLARQAENFAEVINPKGDKVTRHLDKAYFYQFAEAYVEKLAKAGLL